MEIRKNWLIAYFSYTVAVLVFYIVGYILGIEKGSTLLISMSIATVFNVAIVMHCSYVMKGTRLLWVFAYLNPIAVPINLILVSYIYMSGFAVAYTLYFNLVLSPFIFYLAWTSRNLRKRYLYERQQVVMTADVSY